MQKRWEEMNTLVIKIVGGRVKIGVLFPDRAIAEAGYRAFEENSIKRYFSAIIEIHGEFLNLTLTDGNIKVEYQNLKYDGKELMGLRRLMQPNEEILFAHIYNCTVRGLIAIPAKWKNDFIKVNYYHIVIVKKLLH